MSASSSASRAPHVGLLMWVSVLWYTLEGETCQQSHGFAHTDSTRALKTVMRRFDRWGQHENVYTSPVILSVLVNFGEEPTYSDLAEVFDKVRSDYLDSLKVNA